MQTIANGFSAGDFFQSPQMTMQRKRHKTRESIVARAFASHILLASLRRTVTLVFKSFAETKADYLLMEKKKSPVFICQQEKKEFDYESKQV